VLVLALAGEVLVLLRAVGDEVVEVSIAIASILWSTLGSVVLMIVVKL
jgi:hypothetical protein